MKQSRQRIDRDTEKSVSLFLFDTFQCFGVMVMKANIKRRKLAEGAKNMNRFPYFYNNQAEKFTFYRIPKTLFTDERFAMLSVEAKLLYGIMLDRMGLSRTNGLIDNLNRVHIYFTLDEVMECFHCAREKANKLLAELDARGKLSVRPVYGTWRASSVTQLTRVYAASWRRNLPPPF